ncbi:hypothetical protein PGT21_020325 [Puccinia graminis f. sp. tritici]|uniref:Uncharacterized protein n=1 Tax=Puccinia graminis f. sp. tritici TaxID=56615 RepID=A0A5B0MU59_PUCGR|nr:hypothetical protein PGT21_020325 [Puccinia graminis f. sp. tritici]
MSKYDWPGEEPKERKHEQALQVDIVDPTGRADDRVSATCKLRSCPRPADAATRTPQWPMKKRPLPKPVRSSPTSFLIRC